MGDGTMIVLVPVPMATRQLFLMPAGRLVGDLVDVPDDAIDPYYYTPRVQREDSTSVLLVLNDRCNFSCSYCFERQSARSAKELLEENAICAIQRVIDNASRLGRAEAHVSFFGGEPTLSFPTMARLVDRARSIAERRGIRVDFGITTNGYFGVDVADFIARNFRTVILSLDGPRNIHDRHRRTLQGHETFQRVERTAHVLFDKLGSSRLTFRVTLADETVTQLGNVVDFFEQEFLGAYVHLEPALNTNDGPRMVSRYREFSNAFIEAAARVQTLHIQHSDLFFKFKANLDDVDFCGSSSGNFYITPEGAVTSCSRVVRNDDPLSAEFFAGRVHDGGICFDDAARKRLSSWVVSRSEECSSCYARYNCKGGCPSLRRSLASAAPEALAPLCGAVRDLTRDYLKLILSAGGARAQAVATLNS